MSSVKVYRFYIWMPKPVYLFLTVNAPREFSQFQISTVMSGIVRLRIHSSFIKLICHRLRNQLQVHWGIIKKEMLQFWLK